MNCGFSTPSTLVPRIRRRCVRGFFVFSLAVNCELSTVDRSCPFCPSLSCLFSYKYKLPLLQPLCFDNHANCPGGGIPPRGVAVKVLLELPIRRRNVCQEPSTLVPRIFGFGIPVAFTGTACPEHRGAVRPRHAYGDTSSCFLLSAISCGLTKNRGEGVPVTVNSKLGEA